MTPDLVRLVYASRAVPQCDASMLREIVAQARRANADQSITGVLLFDSGVFAQWLEGNAYAVYQTWERIQRDTRHTGAEMLSLARVDDRCFEQWKMGLSATPMSLASEIDGITHSLVYRLDQTVLIPEKLFKVFDTLSELQRLQDM